MTLRIHRLLGWTVLSALLSIPACFPDFDTVQSCTDGAKGQLETDVDCGGPTLCARCGLDEQCTVGADCAAGICSGGVCVDGCDPELDSSCDPVGGGGTSGSSASSPNGGVSSGVLGNSGGRAGAATSGSANGGSGSGSRNGNQNGGSDAGSGSEPTGTGATGLGGTAGEGPVPPLVDLAVGQPARADSEEVGKGNVAALGNDGNVVSRWCANDGQLGHWWRVDLGETRDLYGAEITWEFPRVYGFTVSVSDDDVTYTMAADLTTNTESTQIQPVNFRASGRYVKITVTAMPLSPTTWASFFEVLVYGAAPEGEVPPEGGAGSGGGGSEGGAGSVTHSG